ncbi:hypothetical protein ACIGQ5_22455 [Peribacillus frigoritolerans]|uniref:hypothetical protein n=1 Tax=Peribacillus frigoritolerans TaxID=450367 RepID=UPI0037C9069E
MKNRICLGLFLTVFLILTACGNDDKTFSDLTTDELKNFISEKNTGFILYTYDDDNMEVNKEQVKKALDNNDQTSKYFNYRDQVTNEQSSTFHNDVGSEQLRDSLGYYENGILMAEFEFPNKWNAEQIDNLNKFIEQISE